MQKLTFLALLLSISTLLASEPEWGRGIAPSFSVFLAEESEFYKYGHDGPCGKNLSIQSFKLPIGNPNFELIWVYELSDQGEEISKWAIPNDTSTQAVAGSVLIVSTIDEYQPYFEISSSGHILRSDHIETSSLTREFVECPIKNGFENRYEACVRLFDATQNSHRIISTISVCT